MHDEKFLIFLARIGDTTAADTLIRRYYDDIYAFVYYRAFDKQDAMDITQEVFLRVLRSLSTFDGKKSSFKTWLYHVAASVIIDQNRRSSRIPDAVDIDDVNISDESDLAAAAESSDLARRILAAVKDEDDLSQRILQLKIFACHTTAQIAEELEMPESTVKSKYYRLLKKLKEGMTSL